ncbi:D-3-phosphoglycerate dehydrogenase-like [Rhopilema esculentum]|uniref:D-3-phosphoglycerate dehydrogenase-like n=1 Tax=Rhopilema esculentum TaxID=499914 RepID=UPI0031DB5275
MWTKMAALSNFRRVLITDKIDQSCKAILEKNGVEVTLKPGMPKDEILQVVKDYDCLIVRSATKVTEDLIEAGKNLKIIGRAGTGVDNIDVNAATKRGIFVMNTPGGNTLSAAEHTCALIAAMARNIGQGYATMREGKWERSKLMGCELNGKTLAIIGLGRIGREVATRMSSFGMKIIGFDPIVTPEEAASFGIGYHSLEQIWPIADFITVHTPLLPHLRGLLSQKTFNLCKDGVRVINVARGGLIDEGDLIEALDSGKVAGAALDVFVSEPPSGISAKLVMHPKVVCTPHLGASTVEAQKRVAMEIAQQIVDAMNGKPIIGLVNAPFLMNMGKSDYKCWMELGRKMATLLRCLVKGCTKLEIEVTGKNMGDTKGLINAGVAFGYLQKVNQDSNLINAMEILKQEGIELTWVQSEGIQPQVSLTATTKENTKVAMSGSIAGDSLLLTRVDGEPLSGPVTLSQRVFVYNASSKSNFFKLVADNAIKIESFVMTKTGNKVFGTVADDQDEKINEGFIFCNF